MLTPIADSPSRSNGYNAGMEDALTGLTHRLGKLATHYDVVGEWPEKSLKYLTDVGAWQWIIGADYGGQKLDPFSQLIAYEAVAAGCMASLLILTQRDGACEFIAESPNQELKADILPRLARHEIMTSVGISQLGSGRAGHKRPSLGAKQDRDGYRLSGFMPWVTAAEKCDYIVAGAVLEDQQELLVLLPTRQPGVVIDPPMQLMALQATRTSEVHCKEVFVEPQLVLCGPVEHALAHRTPVKPLVVAASGVGLAGTMMRLIVTYASKMDGSLKELAEELLARYDAVRERVFKYAGAVAAADVRIPKQEIRVAVNDLLMRMAVGVLTYAKGGGFLRQREAQRLAREAMFFLVWSATEQVRTQTLAGFLQDRPAESRSMTLE